MALTRTPLDPATQVRLRRRALEVATHSARIEGETPNPEGSALLERWVAGELSGDDVRALLDACYKRR